eukprot:109556_1
MAPTTEVFLLVVTMYHAITSFELNCTIIYGTTKENCDLVATDINGINFVQDVNATLGNCYYCPLRSYNYDCKSSTITHRDTYDSCLCSECEIIPTESPVVNVTQSTERQQSANASNNDGVIAGVIILIVVFIIIIVVYGWYWFRKKNINLAGQGYAKGTNGVPYQKL